MPPNGNTSLKPRQPGSFWESLIASLVALTWLGLIIGCLAALVYRFSNSTGARWADGSANGAAVCVATVYITGLLAVFLALYKLAFGRSRLTALFYLFLGILPATILFWNIAERQLGNGLASLGNRQSTVLLIGNFFDLGHVRLFGGSLWTQSTDLPNVRGYLENDDEGQKQRLEFANDFVGDVRGVLELSDPQPLRINFDPISELITPDVFSWIVLQQKLADDQPMTEAEWSQLADGILTSELKFDHNPPELLLSGWREYWSQSTDALMDRYFTARSTHMMLPNISELTSDEYYNKATTNHDTVGGAFVSFLIEELKTTDFLKYCQVAGPTDFRTTVEESTSGNWSELSERFEAWLRMEADRLGWDRQATFASTPLDSDSAMLDRIASSLQNVEKLRPDNSAIRRDWDELLEKAAEYYRERMLDVADVGFDKKLTFPKSELYAMPDQKRLRALRSEAGYWYSMNDSKTEEIIVVSDSKSFRGKRDQEEIVRTACTIDSDLERRAAVNQVLNAIRDWRLEGDLIRELNTFANSDAEWVVASIEKTAASEIDIVLRSKKPERENQECEITVASDNGLRVTKRTQKKDSISTEVIERVYASPNEGSVIVRSETAKSERDPASQIRPILVEYSLLDEKTAGSLREELAYITVTDCDAEVPETSSTLQLIRQVCGGLCFISLLCVVGYFVRR